MDIAIIGVGNVLRSDDGIGIHVVNELKRVELPKNVKLFDCGTSGISVLEAMDGADKAIIIDATCSGEEPGTVRIYKLERPAKGRLDKLVSLHQLDIVATIELAELMNIKVPNEIIIIGVEAKSLDYSMELSNEVKNAIPKVIEAVIGEVRAGLRPSLR